MSCILHHRCIHLILAYSWARPAILVVGKGRGECFYSVSSLSFIFLFLPCPSRSSPLPSLLSLLPFSGNWHKMTHKGWHVVKLQHNWWSFAERLLCPRIGWCRGHIVFSVFCMWVRAYKCTSFCTNVCRYVCDPVRLRLRHLYQVEFCSFIVRYPTAGACVYCGHISSSIYIQQYSVA